MFIHYNHDYDYAVSQKFPNQTLLSLISASATVTTVTTTVVTVVYILVRYTQNRCHSSSLLSNHAQS